MQPKQLKNVKKIILIASGKGGVGKSSVAVSTAVLLGKSFKVGLLDSDIYGPSVCFMLGQNAKAQTDANGAFIPCKKHGIEFISMGALVANNSAALWRGPMLAKMLKNFLLNTNWGELDYLIVDTPPGTGDIHITLCTEFKVDAAILVATAQKIAIFDVKRAFDMFCKLSVPVIGVVENMSQSPDGDKYVIGSAKNTQELTDQLQTNVIAKIPFSKQISEYFDNGVPAVVDLQFAKFYNGIVDQIVKTCTNN